MRKFLSIILVCIWSQAYPQAVGINTDGSTPHPSSILHLKNSEKGFLAPRMTTTQRLAINSPAEGLLVYDINTKAFWYFTDGSWEALLNDEYFQHLYLSGDTLRLTQSDNFVTRDGIGYWTKNGNDISRSIGNVGIGVATPLAKLHVEEAMQVTGTYGAGDSLLNPGNVPRMFFYPRKGAFRAGGTIGDQWAEPNIGPYSTAMGFSTSATGDFGVSLGYYNEADGDFSTAMGRTSHAEADYAVAIGHSVWAYSPYETALGSWNTSYTPNSTVLWNEDDRLLVVGNGTAHTNRSDALTILKNGNIGIGTSEPVAHVQISGPNSTDALLWDDGKSAIAHSSDLVRTDRQWLNLLIDADNSQTNAHFAIYNDSTNSDGEAVVSFNLDGGDSWINSGNVGIGTTTPTKLFQVAGDAKIDGSTFNVDAVNNKVGIGTGSPSVRLDVDGSVKVDGSTFNVDANTNKVGIGTATPSADLEISGAYGTEAIVWESGNVALQHSNDLIKTNRDWINILLDANNDQSNSRLALFKNVTSSSGQTPVINLNVDGDSWFDGGNLGIGTTSPLADLSIDGSVNSDAIQLNGGTHAIRHGYEFLATSFNAVRILLDTDNDQEFGGGLEIYNNTNDASTASPEHRFAADDAISSFVYGESESGRFGINTSAPQKELHIDGDLRIESIFSWVDFEPHLFALELHSEEAGGLIGEWDLDNGIYTALSDARLKRNISELSGALDKVSALQPKSYQYKSQDLNVPYTIGFLAQEVKEILPGAVKYNEEQDRYTMDYSAFGVLAIQAIKEQQTHIQDLTSLTEALLARVEILEREVSGISENE